MGWPSILENAFERMNDAWHMLREDSVAGISPITEERKLQVVTILRHCEITLTEARTYLDIATDPSMDLARSLEQARNKKLEIEARMAGYEGSCIALMQELNKEKEKSAGLEKKVEELTRERNRLDKKIAKTMESNPSAIYDAFPPRSSTPGGQKKSK